VAAVCPNDHAQAAVQSYADHPAVSFVDLVAEVATEVRLMRAIEANQHVPPVGARPPAG
jgi:hypothetical protein